MARRPIDTEPDDVPAIKTTRKDLIAALEARRGWAAKSDRARVAQHKRDEKAALEAVRSKLRDALTWDWPTMTEKLSYGDFRIGIERPACPASRVAKLDKAIAPLLLSNQETYTLQPGSTIHFLLTHDDAIVAETC